MCERGFLSKIESIRSEKSLISVNSNGSLLVFLETGLAGAVEPSQSLLRQA